MITFIQRCKKLPEGLLLLHSEGGYEMKRIVIIAILICVCTSLFGTTGMAKTDNRVRLNKTRVTIRNGSSVRLRLKNSKKNVKWSSEDTDIATVNTKGKVTGKRLGSITVTARAGKKKYRCRVTVITNIDSKRIKLTYQNDIFTKSLLPQIKEFQLPATGKVVRDKAAVKKLFGMVSKWKLTEAGAPRGVFANAPDTPPEKLLVGAPFSMVFCLKNKECIELQLSGGQVRLCRYDSPKRTNCTFTKLYEMPENSIAFIDAVCKVTEENRVVYFW